MDVRELTNEVIYAIDNNDKNMVENIFSHNFAPDEKLAISHIATIYCATKERIDILKYLLDNDKIMARETIIDALVEACIKNAEKSVKLLISSRKDVNLANIISEVIIFALDEEQEKAINVVKMLLDNGININAVDNNGKSALEYAIDSENTKLITQLLKYHAYPRYSNKALIGYVLRDLDQARKDLVYLQNSSWLKHILKQKAETKEKIKAILYCKADEELENVLKKIVKDDFSIEKKIYKDGALHVAQELGIKLKQELKDIKEILGVVERFRKRLELNTKNKVLEIIDICKEKGITNLNLNL